MTLRVLLPTSAVCALLVACAPRAALETAPVPAEPEILTHAPAPAAYVPAREPVDLPEVMREFRGVWVATVHNLDWPSRPGLASADAQQELIRILDAARDLGLNAVIFQVRPAADAMYASELEPWSYFLTGEQDRAPEPFWDPLEFAIREAHARGLELHAWFNPFRAGFVRGVGRAAASHVMRTHPEIVRRYGSHFWMDPADPVARRRALDVISDVVRRYDIDAVHLDDYFYPYRERDARGRLIEFPDNTTWQRYGARTGMTRADWRRANIDSFVQQLYHTVRDIRPHVRVGISPFGIWRPGYPESVQGLDSYVELFADSRKWLVNGWADYYAPQLYWRTYAPHQNYAALLQWWADQNPHGRHIWAGNIPNSVREGARGWNASEILEQIRLTREQAGANGNIHFSASSLLRNPDGLSDTLRTRTYAQPALVPAAHWLSSGIPMRPPVALSLDTVARATDVTLQYGAAHPTRLILHTRWNGEWSTQLLPGGTRELRIQWRNGAPPDMIAVRAVDRTGVAGEPAVYVRAAARAQED